VISENGNESFWFDASILSSLFTTMYKRFTPPTPTIMLFLGSEEAAEFMESDWA
jgi:hypothetical protein